MLRKAVPPYEYMDYREKLNEESLPGKEDFYSHLKKEDTTDADYAHTKSVSKDFEINILGDAREFYVESNTLLLVDVFKNFWNLCLEIYKLDTAKFILTPRLAWQAPLKKTKIKLDFLTDNDMLLMVKVKKDELGGKIMTKFAVLRAKFIVT